MSTVSTRRVTTRLAVGLWRVRLPVPFGRLGEVNCYLMKGEEGWTIFDTGLNWPAARAVWYTAAEETGLGPGDLARIVLTHTHPDHAGLAGWLQQEARAAGRVVPVLLSTRERALMQYWYADEEDSVGEVEALLSRCGAPPFLREGGMHDLGRLRQAVRPLPEEAETLAAGRVLRAGDRELEVIAAPGHSRGQLIFYDRAEQLLLAGDQVLAHITPNVSQWPTAGPDPLGQYLASLRDLASLEVERALPGHGPVITDWRGRLRAIRRHHDERLSVAMAAVQAEEGATVYQIAQQLFEMEGFEAGEARFALTETLAHLSHLEQRGRLSRTEANGCWSYHPGG